MVPNLSRFSVSTDFAEAIFHTPNYSNDYTITKSTPVWWDALKSPAADCKVPLEVKRKTSSNKVWLNISITGGFIILSLWCWRCTKHITNSRVTSVHILSITLKWSTHPNQTVARWDALILSNQSANFYSVLSASIKLSSLPHLAYVVVSSHSC